MKFKQRWSNSAGLDFSTSSKAVFDITASATFEKHSSNGLLIDVGKWNSTSQLNFNVPWSADASLEFAIDAGSLPPVTIDVIASANLRLQSVAIVAPVIFIGASATAKSLVSVCAVGSIAPIEAVAVTDAHTSLCDIGFDINVDRGLKKATQSANSDHAKTQKAISSKFSDSPKLGRSLIAKMRDGKELQNSVITLQSSMAKKLANNIAFVRYGDYLTRSVDSVNYRVNDADRATNNLHADGQYLAQSVKSIYVYPPRSDCAKSAKWQYTDALNHKVTTDFSNGVAHKNNMVSYFEDATVPTDNRPIIIPPIVTPKPVYSDLNFLKLWDNTGELDFLFIELDALIIMNTVIMYHTSKGGVKTYINPVSWSIVSDLDSYSWSLNCSLYDENILSLLATDDVFTLSVNGIEWNFNAFKYKRLSDGQFSGYNVTFVSQVQKLGYPIAQPMNISLDAPKGALQLVEEVLGDVPLINKGINEWTLQAGTVDFMQAEPKAIVSEILKATGAVMLPSVTGDKIIIQPRYKVASWLMNELTDAECDVLIDGNYMITDSGEIRNGTEFNAVTINGEKSGTVTKVVLDGTAGDVEATDYTTQIHQDHNVGLEYAKKVFSENGTIELAEISVGLDDNLLQSGSIVRIKHANGDRTGISLGVTVKGDRVENIIQTATIEFRL